MTLKRDILKSEFTLWINTLAYRSKIYYIREKSKYANIIELLETCETQSMPCIECNEVKFESEQLAEAFSNLSVTQQKILTMIYFENKKHMEISTELRCTRQHIYNQCSLAYKRIRAFKKENSGNE